MFSYLTSIFFFFELDESGTHEITSGEEVDELFVNTFNIIKDTSLNGIKKICDFIGKLVKVVV